MGGWKVVLGVVVVVAIAIALILSRGNRPVHTTALEIESYGGFAYVYEQGRLRIAYLKSSTAADCQVTQLGTDLMVVSGNFVPPSPAPATRMFDLGGAIVSFPDLEASSGTLSIDHPSTRRPDPCNLGNPDIESQWSDQSCVPRITWGTPTGAANPTDYPARKPKPNWETDTTVVDGYMMLTRGTVTAMHPADWTLKHTLFDFKKAAAGSTARFTQRLTDRVLIKADVPGDRIRIALANSSTAPRNEPATEIIIEPTAPGRSVKLKLIGRHSHHAKAALSVGDKLDHFCAFYALMDQDPGQAERLIPVVAQVNVPNPYGAGQPSPGVACPGWEWP